jgi:hypothetical protein
MYLTQQADLTEVCGVRTVAPFSCVVRGNKESRRCDQSFQIASFCVDSVAFIRTLHNFYDPKVGGTNENF